MPLLQYVVSQLALNGHTEASSLPVRFEGDCVAKLFCPSERVRLIQDRASMRNVDSRIHSLRFDCCIFLFYSVSAVTFATQSPRKQTSSDTTGMSALPKADICSAANSVSSACRDRQERGGRAAAEQLFIK